MNKIWLIEIIIPVEAADAFMEKFEEDELAESISCFEYEGEEIWKMQGYRQDEPDTAELDSVIGQLASDLSIDIPEYKILTIEDIDWVAESQKNFESVVTGRFFIHASWNKGDIPDDLIPIEIDPQRAFGTGSHETTKGCTLAMQELRNHDFKNILDMGCGSGILAIIAKKLWPEAKIFAVDNDPVCIETTAENASINSVILKTMVSDGYDSGFVKDNSKYDLIISNILAAPLIEFSPKAADSLTDGGIIILAGLLNKDADEVIKAHEDCGFILESKKDINGWTIIVMKKGK